MINNKSINILLVEDEEKKYLLFQDVLAKTHHLNFNLNWAENVEDAVDKMHSNRYNVFLFDRDLGDHSGLDLLEYSIENYPQVPVIILAEDDNFKLDCLAMQNGASNYLLKDQLNPPILSRAIRYAIEQKRQQIVTSQNEGQNRRDCNIDKFYSVISHDLRSPFAAIQSLTDLMLNHYDALGKKERLEYLAIIRDSSDNALKLIDNLMQWSRIQRGIIESVPDYNDLYRIVIKSIAGHKQDAEKKKINLSYQVDMNTRIFADANMIEIVFRNILSNAIKFTPERGNVKVLAQVKETMVELSVEDTGVGMSDKMVEGIFRFEKNKSTPGTANENGTGLGLVLASEFLRLNGGRITVESALGKGSKFTISIPRRAKKQKPKEQMVQS